MYSGPAAVGDAPMGAPQNSPAEASDNEERARTIGMGCHGINAESFHFYGSCMRVECSAVGGHGGGFCVPGEEEPWGMFSPRDL